MPMEKTTNVVGISIIQCDKNVQHKEKITGQKRKATTISGQSIVTGNGIISIEGLSSTIDNDVVSVGNKKISITHDGKAKIVERGMVSHVSGRYVGDGIEIQVSDRMLTIKPCSNQGSINTFTVGNSTFTNFTSGRKPSGNQGGMSSFNIGNVQTLIESNAVPTIVTDEEDDDENLKKVIELSKEKKEQLKIPKEEVEPIVTNGKQEELCSICFERKKCCTIVDCGHSGLCVTCSRKIVLSDKKECPFCRCKIEEGIIKTYQ